MPCPGVNRAIKFAARLVDNSNHRFACQVTPPLESSPTELLAILLKGDQPSEKSTANPQLAPNGRIVNSSKFTARRAGCGNALRGTLDTPETGRHCNSNGTGGITLCRSGRAAVRWTGGRAASQRPTRNRTAVGT